MKAWAKRRDVIEKDRRLGAAWQKNRGQRKEVYLGAPLPICPVGFCELARLLGLCHVEKRSWEHLSELSLRWAVIL